MRRAAVTLLLLLSPVAGVAGGPPSTSAGERIYRDGILPSGKPLRGEREAGAAVDGRVAACATCHRRSGLGSWEGQTVIPPILGRYLFRAGARNVADPDLPHVQGYTPRRDAYDARTLARAIRDGRDPHGRPLSYLMPRYRLADASMASLVAYLKGLGNAPEPGVTRDTLHFATVITPDADPVARKGMLDVLQQFFADKNGGYRGESRPLRTDRGVMYRVTRKWSLHVWELTGPPDGWERQLRDHMAATPVFAIVSGIGAATWGPVHRFCEQAAVPCLFPNVDVPVDAEGDFYDVYFSRGVLLEARLVARQLDGERGRPGLRRIVQVYRPGEAGERAARELAALRPGGLDVVSRALDGRGEGAVRAALQGTGSGDAVVLWLHPADLRALPETPAGAIVFASGLLGGLEDAPLPAAWKGETLVAYPVDLPERRRVRMNFPLGWFKVRGIQVVSERVQVDTYLACVILSETVGHMLDSFVRDYLLERLEVLLDHRQVNGYFPRLALGPGQRFASKGGYLVRFAGSSGNGIVPDGDWTVP